MTEPLATVRLGGDEERARIVVAGEIDLSNASSLREEIASLASGAHAVDLDLTEVTYIDSSGVRLLVFLGRDYAAGRIRFRVVAPPDSIVGGVLRITQVEEFEIVGPGD